MGCLQSQYLLMLRFTQNAVKAKDSYTAYQLSKIEVQKARDGLFTGAMLEDTDKEVDVAKHVVKVCRFVCKPGGGSTQICRCTHLLTMVLKYTPKLNLVMMQKSP